MAQAVLVFLSLGGATALAVQVTTWPDHPLADMTHLVWWAQMTHNRGVEAAYSGTYPETYVIYPPGMVYSLSTAAALAERVPLPPWLAVDDPLRLWVKLVPVAGHIALALAIFAVVATAGGFWRGWVGATLYAWNPGAIFDAAYWGEGDTLFALALVLAIGVLFAPPGWWPLQRAGRWRWTAQALVIPAGAAVGALLAAGGLTKPQAWVFLPMLVWIALRRLGPLGLVALATAAGTVGWWMVGPWQRAGKLDELASVLQNLQQVMPSVSANGHNLWWLKLPGVAIAVLDWNPIGGVGTWHAPDFLTFATVGRLLFGAFVLLPLLRLTGPLSVRLAFAAAGFTAMSYFMGITQVHENHMFAALPFLAAAAALDAWLALPFAIATACVLLNMALHDFLVGDWVAAQMWAHLPSWVQGWIAGPRLVGQGPMSPQDVALALQTANACLNVAGFALFALLFLRRPAARPQTRQGLLWRVRGVMVGGLAAAGVAVAVLLGVLRSPGLQQRLWDRLSESALRIGPVEAHLGHKTPPETLLARAAVDYANWLVAIGSAAAIVGTWTALAGSWWLFCARRAPPTRAD